MTKKVKHLPCLYPDFGKRLTQAREEKLLAQSEAAYLLGVLPNTLRGWEKGRYAPDTLNLEELAIFYETTMDWLWRGVKSEDS